MGASMSVVSSRAVLVCAATLNMVKRLVNGVDGRGNPTTHLQTVRILRGNRCAGGARQHAITNSPGSSKASPRPDSAQEVGQHEIQFNVMIAFEEPLTGGGSCAFSNTLEVTPTFAGWVEGFATAQVSNS